LKLQAMCTFWFIHY